MVKETVLKRSAALVVAGAIAAMAFIALPISANAMGGKSEAAMAAKPGANSIAAIVVGSSDFDVLEAAVIAAGLDGALSGGRQYTVFAPTDAAFVDSLGVANEGAAIAAVQGLPTEALQDILLYHVMPGRHTSTSVLARSQYRTLNGDWLTKAELDLNTPNTSASNGVIHSINSVLGL